MAKTSYALGLGSNRYRGRCPSHTIIHALNLLVETGVEILARSPIVSTKPIGPGSRNFANAVAIVRSGLAPEGLLQLCQRIEAQLGRRRTRRWGDRVLDIDIVLWSGGIWVSRALIVPHPEFRDRTFVLNPLAKVAPDWRDPVSGLSIAHLHHRLHRPMPVDRAHRHP